MATTETDTQEPGKLKFIHAGRVGELFPIVLINALMNILTLTLYRFWGKTRVRFYLWGSTNLLDDRLEYTGTGGELFKGFLFVLFAIFLPVGILNTMVEFNFLPDDPVSIAYNGLLFAGIWFLIGVALYRARRYRLSRTRWRGVRAGQTGSAAAYGCKYLGFFILNILTLGWTYPLMRMRLMHQMMNNTWFGDRRFTFSGSARYLYGRFAISWITLVGVFVLLSVVSEIIGTLGVYAALNSIDTLDSIFPLAATIVVVGFVVLLPIIFCWYKAAEVSYFATSTRFEGATFELDATLGSLLWLLVGNLLISISTLGFGTPFTQMRTFRYVCDRLHADGIIDFNAIIQSSDKGPTFGEGLADAFDVGAV
tara:strand:- start:459 stop:1559 length:1101 start_codon:yes stop_codon:yes gene_type:complete